MRTEPSWLNHFLKAPPPNITALEVKPSTHELWGHLSGSNCNDGGSYSRDNVHLYVLVKLTTTQIYLSLRKGKQTKHQSQSTSPKLHLYSRFWKVRAHRPHVQLHHTFFHLAEPQGFHTKASPTQPSIYSLKFFFCISISVNKSATNSAEATNRECESNFSPCFLSHCYTSNPC